MTKRAGKVSYLKLAIKSLITREELPNAQPQTQQWGKAAWASAWGYSTFTELIIRNFHCNRRCLTGNKEKQNRPTLGSHSLYSRLPVVRKIHLTYRRCKTLPGLLTLVIIRSMNMLWFCHKPVKRVIWLGSATVCAADFLLALCGIYRTWGQGHCSQHKLKTKPRRWNRSGVTEAEVIIFVSFQKQSNKRAHAGECGRSNDALAEKSCSFHTAD